MSLGLFFEAVLALAAVFIVWFTVFVVRQLVRNRPGR